jgi:TfoX/Sxy family transcriptional regulator of competence genes
MPKPDPKAVKLFEQLVAGAPGATVKPMFGNFGAFVGGTMFAGVFGDAVFLRLPEAERATALSLKGAGFLEPMPGRPMKEYVVLPASELGDKKKAGAWLKKSLAYTATIPPKGKGKTAAGKTSRR